MPFDVSMKDSYHMKDFDFYFNSREHISFPETQIRYLRVAFTLSNKLIIRNIAIKKKDPDNKFTFHVSLLFLIAGISENVEATCNFREFSSLVSVYCYELYLCG